MSTPHATPSSSIDVPPWAWMVLGCVVLVCVAIDLFGHRGSHGLGRKAAIGWSIGWIAVSLTFGGFIALQFGGDAAEDYLTAYLVEKSLSVDNLFVFLLVFSRLQIPSEEHHRVLEWGIFGAFVTRGIFVAAGSALLDAWHGVVYVLGAFLVYTGYKTFRSPPQDDDADEDSAIIRLARKFFPVSSTLHGHHFVARTHEGKLSATPLLMALVVIELTDVLFAVDSIPAVFAITQQPFIVYSSNIFAILGLRAMYIVLADLLKDLKYIHHGLAAILVFAGGKMVLSSVLHVPHVVSLAVIVGVLFVTVVASLQAKRRARAHSQPPPQVEAQP